MKVKYKDKIKIKIIILKIFYFVIILLIMINCLHFTQKNNIANAFSNDRGLKQIKVQKIYQNNFDISVNDNKISDNYPKILFEIDGKIYKPDKNVNLTVKQKQIIAEGFFARVKTMNFALQNGFNVEQSVCYCFPEIEKTIKTICENKYKEPENAEILVLPNSAKTNIKEHKNGVKVDDFVLFSKICSEFLTYKDKYVFKVPIKIIPPDVTTEDVKKQNILRGEFSTNFKNSSSSRKNNIKRALKNFDGKVLLPGEILSFNNTTGLRTEENGYEKAKIIKNGMFIEEFGGGVCQVSSTLYNACLLSDLEILESHSHSLPVSYVSEGFDAMVNIGSSDLVIKNSLSTPVIFATSDKNDECKICVYGIGKTAKIVRKYNKISENLHFETIYTDNNIFYNLPEVEKDSEIIINPGKPGKTIESWLEYYDNDVLVKTKKLRISIYSPTKRIILVSKEDISKYKS